MELRSHPALSYRGVPSWPPVWASRDGGKAIRGELGILKYVYSSNSISDKCYLVIEHDDHAYVGCLIVSDMSFCQTVLRLLRSHQGRRIAEIGSIDVSYTL
jgi:hypothetical protein